MDADQKLSISAENALTQIKKDSRFNINDVAFFLASVILAGVGLYGILLDPSGHYRSIVRGMGLILVLPPLIASSVFKRISQNLRVLSLCKDRPPPLFELDKKGMTIPIVLLPCKSDAVVSCIQKNEAVLKVSWEEIQSWTSSYIPQDMYTGEGGIGVFILKRKGSEREIEIDRKFLKGREQEIISFSRQYVSLSDDVLRPDKKQREERWVNKLSWGFITLFMIFLLIVFSGSWLLEKHDEKVAMAELPTTRLLEKASAAYHRHEYQTALKLYLPLAQQGNAAAQFALGLMYKKGEGMKADSVQAYMWVSLAATSNSDDARSAAPYLHFLATEMTPEQIAEGKRLAGEWKPALVPPVSNP